MCAREGVCADVYTRVYTYFNSTCTSETIVIDLQSTQVSLCVMHAIVLERCRFAGGWIQGNVVFSDFLAAVTALQRAFKVVVVVVDVQRNS